MSARIDRGPTELGSRVAIVFAAVAVLLAALTSLTGLSISAIGAFAFGFGTVRGSRRWSNAGAVGIGGGHLLGAAAGAPVELVLLGMVATVVAWDVGEHATSLGEQVGSETRTVRNEVVHLTASVAVGAGGALVSYVVFRTAAGGRPTAALAMLLFGVIALLTALRFVQPSTPAVR